jgi:ubiquinone/menaquinone biosynthesis C-methylase UbiE
MGGAPVGIVATADPLEAFVDAQAVIDFTTPEATLGFAALAAQARAVHVIGTTGMSEAEIAALEPASRHAPIVRAGNMSLGVNLLVGLTRKVAAAAESLVAGCVRRRQAPAREPLRSATRRVGIAVVTSHAPGTSLGGQGGHGGRAELSGQKVGLSTQFARFHTPARRSPERPTLQSPSMERLLAATARAEDTHFWFLGLRRTAQQLLMAAIGTRRLDRIVDCGAGTGRNLEWLARFGEAIGIELEPAGVRLVRARGRTVVRGTVVGLPVADECVDLVTLFDVLQCLDDQAEHQALREISRVLKPGGLLLLNVAALDFLRGSHSTLAKEIRRYSRRTLMARLRRVGFQVDRLTYTNLSLVPAALAVRGFERLTDRMDESERDLQVPSAPFNRGLDLALRLEARWLRRGDLPVGTSIMAVARKPLRPTPASA